MSTRTLSRITFTMALMATLIVVSPVAASANAYVCGTSHGVAGATCMYVTGNADWVEKASVRHFHGDVINLCDRQTHVWYTIRNGATWHNYSHIHTGCVPVFNITLNIRQYCYDPSYIYGEARHDGAWAPGRPRATVSA